MKKLSIAEQIALFEQLNSAGQKESPCPFRREPSTDHKD